MRLDFLSEANQSCCCFGCFDPVNIHFGDKNKWFSGWLHWFFRCESFTEVNVCCRCGMRFFSRPWRLFPRIWTSTIGHWATQLARSVFFQPWGRGWVLLRELSGALWLTTTTATGVWAVCFVLHFRYIEYHVIDGERKTFIRSKCPRNLWGRGRVLLRPLFGALWLTTTTVCDRHIGYFTPIDIQAKVKERR